MLNQKIKLAVGEDEIGLVSQTISIGPFLKIHLSENFSEMSESVSELNLDITYLAGGLIKSSSPDVHFSLSYLFDDKKFWPPQLKIKNRDLKSYYFSRIQFHIDSLDQ